MVVVAELVEAYDAAEELLEEGKPGKSGKSIRFNSRSVPGADDGCGGASVEVLDDALITAPRCRGVVGAPGVRMAAVGVLGVSLVSSDELSSTGNAELVEA